MVRSFGFCLAALLFSLHVFAVDAVVSHTTFYETASGMKSAVEVSWQINPRLLHYVTNAEKKILARIKTDIAFVDDDGIIIIEDHFIAQTVPRSNPDELGAHPVIDLRRYAIKPGLVKVIVALTDLADTLHPFFYSDTFTIARPPADVFYSGIQLIDTITNGTGQTAFKKNGRQQVPFCTNFLDDPRKVLRYYTEIYNSGTVQKADLPLVQRAYITRKPGEGPVEHLLVRDTLATAEVMPVTGNMPITALSSGNYYLILEVENARHIVLNSASFFFQRLNKHPIPNDTAEVTHKDEVDTNVDKVTVLNLNKTFLAKYSTAEIRAILKMLLPISDVTGAKAINGFLKKPDDLYMRYYVYNYFQAINKKDPAKAWKEFSERIIEVNKLFNAHGKRGYETDRGAVYMRYGEPSEIVTVQNEEGTLPYEVWQYNTLRQNNHKDVTNAVFLFYKSNDMSDFILLHSTVEGELQNMSWRNYLYINAAGGNNMNSRAEQYIGNR